MLFTGLSDAIWCNFRPHLLGQRVVPLTVPSKLILHLREPCCLLFLLFLSDPGSELNDIVWLLVRIVNVIDLFIQHFDGPHVLLLFEVEVTGGYLRWYMVQN